MEQNKETITHSVMGRSELVELEDKLSDIKFRMKKAKALHHAVLKHYFESDVLYPFSEDDEIRWNSLEVCRDYDTWRLLLECAYDMIIEANDITEQLIEAVRGRLEGC